MQVWCSDRGPLWMIELWMGFKARGLKQPTQGGSPEGGGHCQLEQLQDVSAFGIITFTWKH